MSRGAKTRVICECAKITKSKKTSKQEHAAEAVGEGLDGMGAKDVICIECSDPLIRRGPLWFIYMAKDFSYFLIQASYPHTVNHTIDHTSRIKPVDHIAVSIE